MKAINLQDWINEEYFAAYQEGRLAEYRQTEPFTYAVLKNFLKKELLIEIKDHLPQIKLEKSHGKGVARKSDWYWGAFSHLDSIRFFLSKEMRGFLKELLGEELVLNKGRVPQMNLFKPKSLGLPVHTDMDEKVGVVGLFQLSEGYEAGLGGELAFYKKESQGLTKFLDIEPVSNTLTLFKVSPSSFHGVNDMKGEWTRQVMTYDWLLKATSTGRVGSEPINLHRHGGAL